MRRTTCRTCAEGGTTTVLVQVGHWGICPIHEAKFLAAKRPTVLDILRRDGMEPKLIGKHTDMIRDRERYRAKQNASS